MKVSCDIIRDLLPLYAEGLTSQTSNEMVDEHLCECDECTRQLGVMKKAAQVPVEVNTGSLNKVKKEIIRRRILAVVTVFLFAATVMLSGALLMDAQIYLTAEQAVESVDVLEDGSIRVHWSNLITGTGSLGDGRVDTSEPTGNYGIIAHTRLQELLFPGQRTPYEELPEEFKAVVSEENYGAKTYQLEGGASSQNFWYCSAKDGTGQMLLWDAGNPYEGEPLSEVNYHLAYYCLILIGLSAVFALPGWKFKRKWYGELCTRFSILFACICLSTVIVSAGQFMEIWGEFTENSRDGLILAVPMTLTALFARQLHRLNKQDKGM